LTPGPKPVSLFPSAPAPAPAPSPGHFEPFENSGLFELVPAPFYLHR
jgi:hypothetical protein